MTDQPNPIDVEVGRRLKRRRTLLGISQERLGELLGVSYQQIQKYERGTNRIGSIGCMDRSHPCQRPLRSSSTCIPIRRTTAD